MVEAEFTEDQQNHPEIQDLMNHSRPHAHVCKGPLPGMTGILTMGAKKLLEYPESERQFKDPTVPESPSLRKRILACCNAIATQAYMSHFTYEF